MKVGRFGPYFQRGDAESLPEGEKPKMASLLKDMDPETVTLELAIATLNMPRELGVQMTKGTDEEPSKEAKVLAANGRFGPYLKWDKETRSIPAEESPLTVTLERAMELFAQPKLRGRSARAAPKVLKELGKHPETEAEIKILDGRYGPYCADGETNASVPKGESIEEVDLDRAIEPLERARRTSVANIEMMRRLSDLYLQVHQPQKTVEILEEAATKITEDPQLLSDVNFDLGVVYETDAASRPADIIVIAPLDGADVRYPIAPLTDAPHAEEAADFVEFVLSAEGRAILDAAGFGNP